jgi:tetratricopeptide (TPR) repeat protein
MIKTKTKKAIALVLGLSLSAIGASAQTRKHSGVLPLTAKSPEARRIAKEAMELYLDQVEQAQAIDSLRKAVKIDPGFAMAHEFLSQISLDPGEQVAEQQKAFATRQHASPGEQLAIEWYQDVLDHKLMSAIVKMNDLLRQYPQDKWVVWMTTWWLMTETQYERAIEIYERSGISASPGLMNNMGYAYAGLRKFDQAFALMESYVAALPKDANPQDSYAEILRMAGHFHQSIQHYQAALAINPEFYSSQFGIADTYSLMGDQVQARKEYEVAFRKFSSLPELHTIQWQTREAITYVRDGDYDGANRAFQAIAKHAHSRHMSQVEADTYRQMAMYQQDPKHALTLLKKADSALAERTNAATALINQEAAQILRARVEAGLKLGDQKLVSSGLAQLHQLSESSNDKLIDVAYQGAAGAAAFSAGNYADAISHLEEDANNPLSLHLLAAAYQHVGNRAEAQGASETLASLNDPTLEQALIVPSFRACYNDPSCSGNIKTGESEQPRRRSRPFLL